MGTLFSVVHPDLAHDCHEPPFLRFVLVKQITGAYVIAKTTVDKVPSADIL